MAAKAHILLQDIQWKKRLRPYCKPLRAACEAALSGRGDQVELTVVLAGDAFVRTLNRDYRGSDKPTNVLSFMGEGAYLGDIVLALETIEREAREQGKPFHGHVMHLVVHGCLHLLGHDHEKPGEARKMETLEVRILKKLGVENPYL